MLISCPLSLQPPLSPHPPDVSDSTKAGDEPQNSPSEAGVAPHAVPLFHALAQTEAESGDGSARLLRSP